MSRGIVVRQWPPLALQIAMTAGAMKENRARAEKGERAIKAYTVCRHEQPRMLGITFHGLESLRRFQHVAAVSECRNVGTVEELFASLRAP